MTNIEHCTDLVGDRNLGMRWEREFCRLAARKGLAFSPHQIGRINSACAYYKNGGGAAWQHLLLPDVTIWSCPGEHHEVKHKTPTDRGDFGLEDYRLQALKWFAERTKQPVYYTIHNHNGNRDDPISRDEDWLACEVSRLYWAIDNRLAHSDWFDSWVGGQRKHVKGWYWPAWLWTPLVEVWARRP